MIGARWQDRVRRLVANLSIEEYLTRRKEGIAGELTRTLDEAR